MRKIERIFVHCTASHITTTSTAEEVVTKFNALLADLKAKGYMEADTVQ